MNFYQEITLIPDAEISPYFLWSKVYTQLHIALAHVKNQHGVDGIGISFPNYKYEEKDGKTFATATNYVFLPILAMNSTNWHCLCGLIG